MKQYTVVVVVVVKERYSLKCGTFYSPWSLGEKSCVACQGQQMVANRPNEIDLTKSANGPNEIGEWADWGVAPALALPRFAVTQIAVMP